MPKKYSALILPGGGLGDLIVSAPIVRWLTNQLGDLFDFQMALPTSEQNYRDILEIFAPESLEHKTHSFEKESPPPDYHDHMEISMNEICLVRISEAARAEIWPKIKVFLQGSLRCQALGKTVIHAPYMNNALVRQLVKKGLTRQTSPLWSLGFDDSQIKEILDYQPNFESLPPLPIELEGKKYITINDGWAGEIKSRPTKSWGKEKWAEFVRLARKSGLFVVQLGGTSNGEDYNVDLNLRGKLSLKESLSVLKASQCHVDIEGGLVHAATALGTTCVVLFGPTPVKYFGYPQNTNLTHGSCQDCWWILENWMNECRWEKDNVCMNHAPENVLESVLKRLA